MNTRLVFVACGIVSLLVVTIAVINYRGTTVAAAPRHVDEKGASSSSIRLDTPKWSGGTRITVEVLNATRIRGLARRATLTLRDQGFDVVSTGTNKDLFDSTQVLDRTGHREWAERAAKAMGGGTVLMRPDTSRDVDLTVLIGASWRPPPQPFYP